MGLEAPARLIAVITAFALLLVITPACGAEISVRATVSPQRAQVGEPMTLAIDINGAQNVPALTLGNIDGFDVQYAGPSTQISIVNGQMNAAIQHRYSLVPMRQGHFTLGPFSVDYQGKRYQTAVIGVDIVAAGQPQAQGQAPSGQAQPNQAQGAQQAAGNPRALRLALSVPKQEVFLHEKLPIDVTLYVGSIRVADVQYPTLPGDGLLVDKFPQPTQRQQTIDNEAFQVVHFQTMIIPLRAGALTLGPAALQLNVLNRRRDQFFSDPFFERFFQDDPFTTQRRPLELHSDPITLNVLPLPEQDKPPGFSGAVGTFTMQVTAAPTELNAGDPITTHITLNGSGNLADAGPPELTSTDGFRTYEPHASKTEGEGTSINRSIEQVLIPNDATVHAVPPIRFSYFDPQQRRYRTLQSEPIALVVRAPKNAPHAEVVAGGAAAPRAVPEEKLGRDIVYIKDDPGHLAERAAPAYRRLTFLLWQPVPLALFAAAVWYDRRRQRLSGDMRYARFSRAGKEARRGLTTAAQALTRGDRQRFYDAVSRTMQEYLAAKLDLPPGGIDTQAVRTRGVPDDCAGRIADFFTTCEHVRFAPGADDGDMRGTLALAQDVIKRLERQRRPTPGLAARAAVVLVVVVTGVGRSRADAPAASPQTTFYHANALYKDGQYADAAKEYEQVVQSGLESGNLYFNLGNAYFKAGEKGKAILNYERARRLIPRDPDLEANLAYTQSLAGIDVCVPVLWQRVAFPLAHRTSTSQLMWATSGFYTLLLAGLAVYRLWPRRPRWLVYASTTLAVLVLVATTSLGQQVLSDDWQHAAVVVGGDTAARFEPADTGTVHFSLKEGSLVRVLDTRPGWVQIARCDGLRGWVERTNVEDL
jgi:tetratricopeptide (TPR) repeat protein